MIPFKILVVGGCGYIGTHMVKALLEAGHHPIILDNLSTGHRELLPGGTFIEGDIADRPLLDSIFSTHTIDAVMHFAAYIEVGESVQNPLKYYRNNFIATANLIEAMLAHKVLRFIFSSSAAVYGEPQYMPIDEKHPCAPSSPYGESKLFVEKLLESCRNAHDLQYVSLRYFNAAGADPSGLIGECHIPESHLIPLVLDAASGKRPDIKIFGSDYPTPDGTCIRDYIHVNDLVQAHLLALNKMLKEKHSAIYNVGNSRGYTVKEVIKTVKKITDANIKVILSARRPGDAAELIADSTKIKTQLTWKPIYESIETMVRTAWKWQQRRYLLEAKINKSTKAIEPTT